MQVLNSGLVDIVRDFLLAHERLLALFARYRDGELRFDEVRALIGDDDRSPLFRLKERCHSLFRAEHSLVSGMRREALFDLAVGSLFHEAMKFRENFYQEDVYAPKVRKLREEAAAGGGEDDELFDEFAKIQGGVESRLSETVGETQALLEHTREQLRVLLREHADNGLTTRYLIEQRARAERVFPEGLEELLASIHGSATEAYLAAGCSYLEGAHFGRGRRALEGAAERGADPIALAPLLHYTRGMQAFLDGDYGESLAELEAWLECRAEAPEPAYASLADSALERLDRLVNGDQRAALLERAERVREQLVGGD